MRKCKLLFVFLIFFILPTVLLAQVDTAWVRRYRGSGNSCDNARAIAVVNQGNVYVTGGSAGSNLWFDYATIKYNSLGIQEWVARYNGAQNYNDYARAIAVDEEGCVYVTGQSYVSGIQSSDYTTIKYMPTGEIKENEIVPLPFVMANCAELYPSPVKSYLTIRSLPTADRSAIKIFDISGKLIKEIASPASESHNNQEREIRISLKGINPGIYFLQLGKETKKLLVVK